MDNAGLANVWLEALGEASGEDDKQPSSTVSPCSARCPVRMTADIIEHKWATRLVGELLGGKRRFSELQRAMGSISTKILTERLRQLEQQQLLTRTVYATVPPTTEYELTALGRELEGVILAMRDFGLRLQQVEVAKAALALAAAGAGDD